MLDADQRTALCAWIGRTLEAISCADEILVEDAVITATDEGYFLSADFGIAINARLEEALKSGLSLYFLIEFQLERGRWYWFDERTAARAASGNSLSGFIGVMLGVWL